MEHITLFGGTGAGYVGAFLHSSTRCLAQAHLGDGGAESAGLDFDFARLQRRGVPRAIFIERERRVGPRVRMGDGSTTSSAEQSLRDAEGAARKIFPNVEPHVAGDASASSAAEQPRADPTKDGADTVLENVEFWSDITAFQTSSRSIALLKDGFMSTGDTNTSALDVYGNGIAMWSDPVVEEHLSESLRSLLEQCDAVQGFTMAVDVDSGFGGVMTRFAELVRDECSRSPILTALTLESCSNDIRSKNLSLINRGLALSALSDLSSAVVPLYELEDGKVVTWDKLFHGARGGAILGALSAATMKRDDTLDLRGFCQRISPVPSRPFASIANALFATEPLTRALDPFAPSRRALSILEVYMSPVERETMQSIFQNVVRCDAEARDARILQRSLFCPSWMRKALKLPPADHHHATCVPVYSATRFVNDENTQKYVQEAGNSLRSVGQSVAVSLSGGALEMDEFAIAVDKLAAVADAYEAE